MPVANLIIDSDSHVTEPADVWTARVPKKYVDDVPHVERVDGADIWMLQNKRIGTVGTSAPAGWPTFPAELPADLRRLPPGRLECHGAAGLHGRGGHLGPGALPQRRRASGARTSSPSTTTSSSSLSVRAYNDFLIEWCGADLRRLLPVLATPFWDVEATVREVTRCAAAGARGILFTGEPQRYGLPVIGQPPLGPAVGRRHRDRVCPSTSTSATPGTCRAS